MKEKSTQNKETKSLLKASVEQTDFLEIISKAHSLIEKRSIIPILSKVLIQARENSLHIQATDQDNSIQSDIPANVEKKGEIVLDSQSLFDILKELTTGNVYLQEQSGKKLRLSQKASIFNLIGMDSKDFPAFPSFSMKDSFFIASNLLKKLVEKSSYCASMDETRYHLNGVFFEIVESAKNFYFRFVATDTHRMALAEEPCPNKHFLKEGVIIPDKGVKEIKKLISYSEEDQIECAVDIPRILFRHKKTVLSIKLVEGKYPNYQQLIPKKSSISLTVDSDVFSKALRRAALLSSTRFKAVTLDIQKNKICMKAEDSERGFAQDEVEVIQKTGSDLKVRFNARYVLDAINSLDAPNIRLEFNNSEAACLLRPEDHKSSSRYISIIMPMKI